MQTTSEQPTQQLQQGHDQAMVVQKEEEMPRSALSTFRAKEEEIERKKMEVRDKVLSQLGRVEEETRRLATIREIEDSKDPPCKRRFYYCYLSDGEHDELIDVKPRYTASAAVPVVLLLSRSKHK